jgi:hypothetical protein
MYAPSNLGEGRRGGGLIQWIQREALWAHRGRSPALHNLLALFWRGTNTGGTASRPRRRLRASRVDGKRWLWKVGRAV